MPAFSKKKAHVSMQDVADHAKVSKCTVSKVLNRPGDVSETSKAKVLAACEKLGYSLNPSIQDLLRNGVTGHSQDISFVLVGAEFTNPSYVGMIGGTSRGVEKYNLRLILSTLSGSEESIYSLPPAIRDHRVGGILISGLLNEKVISLIRETGIPYVVIGNYPNAVTSFSSSVELNIGNLMHLIMRELKAKNKSRIAILYEDPDNFYSQECFNEFKNALEANCMPFYPELIFRGKNVAFNAFDVMESVLSKDGIMFDAIISFNFLSSWEISCQLISKFGREKANQTIIITIADLTSKMPLPAIVCEEASSKLAKMGLDLLVEKLKDPDMENKRVSFTPTLKMCNADLINPQR